MVMILNKLRNFIQTTQIEMDRHLLSILTNSTQTMTSILKLQKMTRKSSLLIQPAIQIKLDSIITTTSEKKVVSLTIFKIFKPLIQIPFP